MKTKILSITAIGTNLRLMKLSIDDDTTYTVRISDKLYTELKKENIPTGQYLRYHKNDR